MKCARCRDLLFEYVHGSLSEGVRREVEEHIGQCAACRREAEATHRSLAALDRVDPPNPFDAEAGLAALRKRIAASPEPQAPWWARLRPLRWPAVAAAAAAAIAVTVLYPKGPPIDSSRPSEVARTEEPTAPSSEDSEARNLDVLVELFDEMPLFEEFDLFSEHETLASLAEADDATLDQLLEEVGG